MNLLFSSNEDFSLIKKKKKEIGRLSLRPEDIVFY